MPSIGPGVRIGEFCVIEPDVEIGADCLLEPYVYVKRWTTLGERNEISAGTVLGTDPLDKNFTGERSYLRIGNGNKIREHYTISRGTPPESATEIGDDNYIMTCGHIAHNCKIGNHTVIASCALLGGYVEIEDDAFISGGVVVHQFSKIGRLAMIGGNTRVNLDVPPFFTYRRVRHRAQRAERGRAEARRLRRPAHQHPQAGLPLSLPLQPETRGGALPHRDRNPDARDAPPRRLHPLQPPRHLPRIAASASTSPDSAAQSDLCMPGIALRNVRSSAFATT